MRCCTSKALISRASIMRQYRYLALLHDWRFRSASRTPPPPFCASPAEGSAPVRPGIRRKVGSGLHFEVSIWIGEVSARIKGATGILSCSVRLSRTRDCESGGRPIGKLHNQVGLIEKTSANGFQSFVTQHRHSSARFEIGCRISPPGLTWCLRPTLL